jgi:hypothetical protein
MSGVFLWLSCCATIFRFLFLFSYCRCRGVLSYQILQQNYAQKPVDIQYSYNMDIKCLYSKGVKNHTGTDTHLNALVWLALCLVPQP